MAWEKFVACADTHGYLEDSEVVNTFLSFVDDYKPDYKFHLGDLFDFTALRKGIINKADPDAQGDLWKDQQAAYDFLDRYRPDVITLGNHDARLWRMAGEYDATKRELARYMILEFEGILKEIGCSYLPYHIKKGVFELGELKMAHGFHCNQNSTKQHAAEYGGMFMFGHTHRAEIRKAKRNDDSIGYNIGCLCDYERMSYCSQRTATHEWRHAWAYGVVNNVSGKAHVWLAEKTEDEKWLLPTEIKAYGKP